MKALKIVFALLAAGWAIALIPKLLKTISQSGAPFGISHILGTCAGILIAVAVSVALFRSALK